MITDIIFQLLNLVFILLGRLDSARWLITEKVHNRGSITAFEVINSSAFLFMRLFAYKYEKLKKSVIIILNKIDDVFKIPFLSSFSYSSSFKLKSISIDDFIYSMITNESISLSWSLSSFNISWL